MTARLSDENLLKMPANISVYVIDEKEFKRFEALLTKNFVHNLQGIFAKRARRERTRPGMSRFQDCGCTD